MEICNLLSCGIKYDFVLNSSHPTLSYLFNPHLSFPLGLHNLLVPVVFTLLLVRIFGGLFRYKRFEKSRQWGWFFKLKGHQQKMLVYLLLYLLLFFLGCIDIVNQLYLDLFRSIFSLACAGDGSKDGKEEREMGTRSTREEGETSSSPEGSEKNPQEDPKESEDKNPTFEGEEETVETPAPDKGKTPLSSETPLSSDTEESSGDSELSLRDLQVGHRDEGAGPSIRKDSTRATKRLHQEMTELEVGQEASESRKGKRRLTNSPVHPSELNPADAMSHLWGSSAQEIGSNLPKLNREVLEDMVELQDKHEKKRQKKG